MCSLKRKNLISLLLPVKICCEKLHSCVCIYILDYVLKESRSGKAKALLLQVSFLDSISVSTSIYIILQITILAHAGISRDINA